MTQKSNFDFEELMKALSKKQNSTPLIGDKNQQQAQLAQQAGTSAVSQGALQGFQVGGVKGAAAGAALGVLQAKELKKQATRAIEANKTKDLGNIRKEEQDKVSNILGLSLIHI